MDCCFYEAVTFCGHIPYAPTVRESKLLNVSSSVRAIPPPISITDLSEEDAKKIIRETADQFFDADPLIMNEATRISLAAELITEVLVPMNREFALICTKGDMGVADLTSLEPPREVSLHAAWNPQSMPSMMSQSDFNLMHRPNSYSICPFGKWKTMNAADLWLTWKYRRDYRKGFIFAPNVKQEELSEHYNTWNGWGIEVDVTETAYPERWEGLRNHIFECYCHGNKKHFEWLISWMADCLQNPMVKPGSAIVIRGVKGSGKTLIADVLKRLIGRQYFQRLDKPSQLTGTFNGHFMNALLVNPEEAFFSGDKAAEGVLKNLITSTDFNYRLMRTDGFNAKNFSRFLFTSNEEWVVPASFDDRRWFPIKCSGKYAKNKDYFGLIWTQLEDMGGLEEFMKFLLTWEIPKWVDLGNPPETEELAAQVEAGLTIPERFFWNSVKSGEGYPLSQGGTVIRREVKEAYDEWLNRYGNKYDATNDNLFSTLIAKFWKAEKITQRKFNPTTRSLDTQYKIPSLSDVRARLTKEFNLAGDTFECDDAEEDDAEA